MKNALSTAQDAAPNYQGSGFSPVIVDYT